MTTNSLTDELKFTPTMKILNEEQLSALHQATLDVLEKTGVSITHPKALEILDGAGCKVDANRVYFPPELVEKAISTAPKSVKLGNRDNSCNITLEGANTYFGATIDCVNYLDPDTQAVSECKSDHVIGMAKLCDALDKYDWTMTLGISRDLPEHIQDRGVARIALEHCSKPVIVSCNDAESLKEIYEMALLCQGGVENFNKAPLLGTLNCTISPLTHDDHLVGKNIYAAEKGIPIVHYSGMQLGGSFPATLAGGIVMGSAESLSGLVLQQVINPGAPFVFGSFITIMDMKTTVFSYGAIEMAMMVGGMSQLSQRYGLPFFSTAGCTDSKSVDAQAAAEGSLQDLVVATVGGGLVHDTHCWLDHGSILSPAHLVMGQEILRMVNKFTQGIDVSSDTVALDVIDKVGPGGTFLMEPHTMKNFKNVLYPELFQRTKAQAPGTTLEETFDDRLRTRTLELLKAPPKNPLSEEIVREFDLRQKKWGEL
ncbi:trimethylamine---corrinoid protein Co-methyltransferase [Desulfocicer vacuolatum DSM 3385]|uniref:Trimethylamine---corrinoid protein Co-methyltransferase n=1 Tax=Desulfocicer vacuolatum DSM 3385 TaxID=1121400 RepID=A0A1W2D992_9BACT|nr:trimethylamine methyltransferase family protein [Desulfocicer vacuolatum]SMC94127.1 trimethylamine---corrinoid protein Co-methyltransferase [Desulfocicer vacuolatum DSM 3385]